MPTWSRHSVTRNPVSGGSTTCAERYFLDRSDRAIDVGSRDVEMGGGADHRRAGGEHEDAPLLELRREIRRASPSGTDVEEHQVGVNRVGIEPQWVDAANPLGQALGVGVAVSYTHLTLPTIYSV